VLEGLVERAYHKLLATPTALLEAETTCETSEGEGGSTSSGHLSPMEAQVVQNGHGSPVEQDPVSTVVPLQAWDMPKTQLDGDSLSSNTKAWTPDGGIIAPPVPKDRFVPQCEAMMAAVKAALASCQYVCGPAPDYGVEVRHDLDGWYVITHIHPTAVHHTQQVLSIAKETLLWVATESETVYVLGYSARPFQATNWGFIAKLGELKGKWHHACTDIFRKGFCPRGESCFYAHPKTQTSVNFVVQSW